MMNKKMYVVMLYKEREMRKDDLMRLLTMINKLREKYDCFEWEVSGTSDIKWFEFKIEWESFPVISELIEDRMRCVTRND